MLLITDNITSMIGWWPKILFIEFELYFCLWFPSYSRCVCLQGRIAWCSTCCRWFAMASQTTFPVFPSLFFYNTPNFAVVCCSNISVMFLCHIYVICHILWSTNFVCYLAWNYLVTWPPASSLVMLVMSKCVDFHSTFAIHLTIN